ncbi:hypothetical protein ACIQNG_05760 [Streptomyces sp. NPDC091377]|uniref:hypothetical protein n=1 Tax=Streptomyces sp. NPDC091377 TaxID=3365995 RepID=UPI003821C010
MTTPGCTPEPRPTDDPPLTALPGPPAPPGPDSFTLSVPETWSVYDLYGDTLAQARVRVLRETADRDEREQVNRVFRTARRILQSARQRGALYAAGTTTLLEDGLLLAGVMVFKVSPPPGQTFSAEELGRQFATAGRLTRPGTRRFTAHELPHVGPVGRLTGIEVSHPTSDLTYQLLAVNTVVPVPGSSGALVISCFSPNLPRAGQLYRVFDAITATFRFTSLREGPVS